MSDRAAPTRWQPTWVLLQTALLGAGLMAAAIVTHRVDLLVFSAGFIAVTAWALALRPRREPTFEPPRLTSRRPLELTRQQWTREIRDLDPHVEQVICSVTPQEYLRTDLDGSTLVIVPTDDRVNLLIDWSATRWGRHVALPTRAHVLAAWGAYRFGPVDDVGESVTARPAPDPFAGHAAIPRPTGLVGQNKGARTGDGAEFAEIRPFRTGDRLRRISWPITARTGTLHVRTSYAELDTSVLLVLDASSDFGRSRAHPERDSALDVGMRACVTVAQHFLRHGERVGVRVIGSVRQERVRAGAGSAQLHRIVDSLMTVSPGGVRALPTDPSRLTTASDGLIVLVSALVDQEVLRIAATLAQHGHPLVVIDCMPHDVDVAATEPDRLARRLRMIERDHEVRMLRSHGAPVISWQGSGTIDHVLLQLARRPPRMVHR